MCGCTCLAALVVGTRRPEQRRCLIQQSAHLDASKKTKNEKPNVPNEAPRKVAGHVVGTGK